MTNENPNRTFRLLVLRLFSSPRHVPSESYAGAMKPSAATKATWLAHQKQRPPRDEQKFASTLHVARTLQLNDQPLCSRRGAKIEPSLLTDIRTDTAEARL